MAAESTEAAREAAERQYLMLCLLALLAVVGALVQYDKGAWAFLPFAVGGFGLMANWGGGPPLLLLSVAVLTPVRAAGGVVAFGAGQAVGRDPLNDLLLCAGLLAFTAGHYRLQAIVRGIFPPEPVPAARPRPDGKGAVRQAPARRSPGSVTGAEVRRLALSVPVWCGLAFVAWRLLPPGPEQPHGFGEARWGGWRALALCWMALLVTGVVRAVLGYLGGARAGTGESLVYLQDQVWRATVREQGRVQRWLMWGRLRRQRREER